MSEWTAALIKEAIGEKRCPFCKSREFNVLVHQIRSFVFDENGKRHQQKGIQNEKGDGEIWCAGCGEEIVEAVWAKWLKGEK